MNLGGMLFSAPTAYGTIFEPANIAAADYDLDGDFDMVAPNFHTSFFNCHENNGNGTFAPKVDFACGSGPTFAGRAYLDGNGTPAIVTTNAFSDNVSVFLNQTPPVSTLIPTLSEWGLIAFGLIFWD